MVRPAGEGRVCVGVIAGVHGVKGLVRVKAFTEVDDDFVADLNDFVKSTQKFA